MDWNKLINFNDYSHLDIGLILAGTIMWILAYALVLRNAIRKKFVEMPAPAAAANIAWEFVWAFLLVTNLGVLFQWGLRIWFIMDLFILYYLLRYGAKQVNHMVYKKNFKWTLIAQVILWIPAFYYFYKEGYDTLMGTTSAFVITIPMAVLFIVFYINARDKKLFSKEVAITKFLGNLCMTLFVFVHHTDGFMFVKLITVVVMILNLMYIYIIFSGQRRQD